MAVLNMDPPALASGPHLTMAYNDQRQVAFLLLAFKACEAVGMNPAHVQCLSTLLPAVLLAARPTWVA